MNAIDPSRRIGMDAERQLRLLEHRHAEALRFIDHMDMRIRYDEWMARAGLASEFVTGTYPDHLTADAHDWEPPAVTVQPYPPCDCGHRHDRHRHHVPMRCYECDDCPGYHISWSEA